MKKICSLFLSAIIVVSVCLLSAPAALAASYSGSAGNNVTWSLDTYSGVITFSGIGDMADFTPGSQPEWSRYQGYIKSVAVESGVTGIGDYAFYNGGSGFKYQKLTLLDCADSVTDIGKYAFRGCRGLTQVINAGSLDKIGEYAFLSCTALESFDFGQVSVIENGAFTNCESLDGITLPETLETIDSAAFKGCISLSDVTVPVNVATLGSGAFAECTGLDNVVIDTNKLASSDTSVFYGSGSPDGMTASFGSGVTSVRKNLFFNCTNLKYVNLAGVQTINENAFANSGLVSVNIPSAVTSVNAKAFAGCNSLTGFTVDSANTTLSANSDGLLMNKNGTSIVRYPAGRTAESYTIAYPVTSMSIYAFSRSDNLKIITVASGVSAVNNGAFEDCANIEDINLGSSVTQIGNYAFANCDMLQNLNIGSVTSIGSFAFFGCDSLHSFTSSTALKTISSYAFSNCKSLTQAILSEGLTTLGSYAFSHCISLIKTVIPSSVSTISTGAYLNCDTLNDVTITKGVRTISENAFLNCGAMTSITVPSSVTTVGSHALGYSYSSNYTPVNGFKIYCTSGSAAYNYARNVSTFQTEIITDSVDGIIIDEPADNTVPSVRDIIGSITDFIIHFDLVGFIKYISNTIMEIIQKINIL